MQRKFPLEYNFHPDGFVLPGDRDNFERVVHADMRSSNSKKKLWIVKVCVDCRFASFLSNICSLWPQVVEEEFE